MPAGYDSTGLVSDVVTIKDFETFKAAVWPALGCKKGYDSKQAAVCKHTAQRS